MKLCSSDNHCTIVPQALSGLYLTGQNMDWLHLRNTFPWNYFLLTMALDLARQFGAVSLVLSRNAYFRKFWLLESI